MANCASEKLTLMVGIGNSFCSMYGAERRPKSSPMGGASERKRDEDACDNGS